MEEVISTDEFLLEKADNGIVVIGGAEIYKALMPYVDEAYVSEFNSVAEADTFFPVAELQKHMNFGEIVHTCAEFDLVRYVKKTV